MHNRRGSRCIIGWAVAAVTAAALAFGVWAATGSAHGIRVDGITLSQTELALGEHRVLRDVQHRGGDDAEVRVAAVQALRDDLALFAVAGEAGATDVQRPDDILRLVDAVNADRRESATGGEVVYGQLQYGETAFYGKTLTDIRHATIAALVASGDPRMTVSEQQLRERFDADREQWSVYASTLTLTRIWVPTPIAPGTGVDVAATTEGSVVQTQLVERSALDDGTWNPTVVAALDAAVPGEVLAPEPSRGGWELIRLDDRTVDADAAFERYRTRIEALLLDERLDDLIDHARTTQRVELD